MNLILQNCNRSVFLGLLCLRSLSICVSVCLHNILKTLHPIFMKLGIQVHVVKWKNHDDFRLNQLKGETVVCFLNGEKVSLYQSIDESIENWDQTLLREHGQKIHACWNMLITIYIFQLVISRHNRHSGFVSRAFSTTDCTCLFIGWTINDKGWI